MVHREKHQDQETSIADLERHLTSVMERFYPIGEDPTGGVTRLGYSDVEDEMHEAFLALSEEYGFLTWEDSMGNHYCSVDGARQGRVLIGSHLDSVVNGGRFDGVLGVAVGLAILATTNAPGVIVGALRCEESSNFRKDCIGSSVITGLFQEKDLQRESREGETLEAVLARKGYDPFSAYLPEVDAFYEVHIEQGRVLESEDLPIGVVTAIAGNQRIFVKWKGMAEHSGATPMSLRTDSLAAAAALVLEVEKIGRKHAVENCVATVGEIRNYPNAINVVPGDTHMSIDLRSTSLTSIEQMKREALDAIERIRVERDIEVSVEEITPTVPAEMNPEIVAKFSKACEDLGVAYKQMPSGAGHDAMKFAKVLPTGMLFVPCLGGVSHNPKEHAEIRDAASAARVLIEVLQQK